MPDRVSQESGSVFWSYMPAHGLAGWLSLRFIEGGLVEVTRYDR